MPSAAAGATTRAGPCAATGAATAMKARSATNRMMNLSEPRAPSPELSHAPGGAIRRIVRRAADALVAIRLVAVQAHVRELLGDIADLFLIPGLRRGVDLFRHLLQFDRELDPVRVVDGDRLAVLAAAPLRQHQRRGFADRDGRVIHELPALIDAGAPVDP